MENKNIIKENLDKIVAKLDDLKANEVTVLDVVGKTDICDYMVVASGTSTRHVSAVAGKLIEYLKHDLGDVPYQAEGINEGYWVLIDCYDIVIHLMQKEAREFYELEKIWS